MSLENLTGPNTGFNDLVPTNPDGTDPVSEGDNHIRGVKNVTVNVLGPMVSAAVSLPQVGQQLAWDGAKYAPVSAPVSESAGVVKDFAGALAQIPAGYLNCDGASVLRASYAALFSAIGVLWGSADGTHFNLPNLSRRATVGAGGTGTGTIGNAVGNVGGEENHVLIVAELALHRHQSRNVLAGPGSIAPSGSNGIDGGFIDTSDVGANAPHNTMQPSAIMLKIIKT